MRIIVSSIPAEGLRQEIELPVKLEKRGRSEIAHAVIKANRFGDRVLIDGRIEFRASLICSRCLKEFPYPLDIDFEEEFVPSPEVSESGEHELTGEDLDLGFYSNDEIDIDDVIREQLLLAIPMKPVCRSDCAGICPKCGKDLNEGACDCRTEEVDPRLNALKEIKKSLKKK